MAERFCDGLKLGKFPSFTSISVVDNFHAVLWAGFIQDIEAVVSDFILQKEWDYNTFLLIAESRGTVILHRCAFNIFSHDRGITQLNDRSRRGKTRDQLIGYKRIMNTIFNVTKDIWLEPLLPLLGRNPLADLKRRITGLYLLYYLWHNQMPTDEYKVLIRYSPDDQARASAVGQIFLKLEKKIPNATLVKNCYKYLVTALSKRNAFLCTYIVDEPKIEFQHWQHMHLKTTGMRKCVTSVNANNHFYQILPELEKICVKMTDILKEVDEVARVPITKSFFFRNILTLFEIKNIVKFDDETLKPVAIALPFSYVTIADVIANLVSKNLLSIERPFLTLDTLLQTDRAPNKIRVNGIRMAREIRQKYIYNKTSYERSKATFNSKCDKHNVPKYKISKTKKYREMKSPGWLFINREFFKIFNPEPKITATERLGIHKSDNFKSPLVSSLVSIPEAVPLLKYKSVDANWRRNCMKQDTTVSEKLLTSSESPERSVSKQIKGMPAVLGKNQEEFFFRDGELIVGSAKSRTLNSTIPATYIYQRPGSSMVPSVSKAVAVADTTSFDLDEDEKLLQAAILKSGKVVVGESTETLKSMYGLRSNKSKRRRVEIDPLSTTEKNQHTFSASSDEVPTIDLESSDEHFSD